MFILQQQCRIMFFLTLSTLCRQGGPEQCAAKSGHGEFPKIASGQGGLINYISFVHFS
jgi:hypothetical protein